jgi:hypothetical protein
VARRQIQAIAGICPQGHFPVHAAVCVCEFTPRITKISKEQIFYFSLTSIMPNLLQLGFFY